MYTKDQTRRIIEALAETSALIEREEKRGPVNRPAHVEKLLVSWHEHRAKLNLMLAA